MEPIIALTVLFCVYAAGELIAQKSKAVFSTVLGIAILLLAGFWSGILPRSVIEDAQVTGFGNVIAGILIVSLGTTIDFPELRRQWKVVVTALDWKGDGPVRGPHLRRRQRGHPDHDHRPG